MPRSPRIQYEGAIYHVMSRGDRREAIYLDDQDRKMFLATLEEACKRAGVHIYSYVLMGNHYHLLLQTPDGNLVDGMRWLQSTYTARFNARHRQRGHLFQGRYKAIPIQGDEAHYLRIVSDYIHLNPTRGGIVNASSPELKDYSWSSFPIICGKGEVPPWLKADELLEWYGLEARSRHHRREYEKYLQGRAQACWEEKAPSNPEEKEWLQAIRRGWYLGGDTFREKLEGLAAIVIKNHKRESYTTEALRRHDEKEAERLLASGLKVLGLSIKEVRMLKQNDPRKQALAWLIKNNSTVPDSWIQNHLAIGHRSNITRAVSQYRNPSTLRVLRYQRKMMKCAD